MYATGDYMQLLALALKQVKFLKALVLAVLTNLYICMEVVVNRLHEMQHIKQQIDN